MPSALSVRSGSSTEPFLPDKLYTEILLALQDRKDAFVAAREVTNTVVKELLKIPEQPLFTPKQISTAAAKVLGRFDKRARLRFVAEHPSLQN